MQQRLLPLLLVLISLFGCQPHGERENARGAAHDLSRDELRGGHTLSRHVGRTDQQLRERLQQEPQISASSTYFDRQTAEWVVTEALEQNADKIQRWIQRGFPRPNLVLDYVGDPDHHIGRVLHREATEPVPCERAIVVLKADGPNDYHVLTSYPECLE